MNTFPTTTRFRHAVRGVFDAQRPRKLRGSRTTDLEQAAWGAAKLRFLAAAQEVGAPWAEIFRFSDEKRGQKSEESEASLVFVYI